MIFSKALHQPTVLISFLMTFSFSKKYNKIKAKKSLKERVQTVNLDYRECDKLKLMHSLDHLLWCCTILSLVSMK